MVKHGQKWVWSLVHKTLKSAVSQELIYGVKWFFVWW